MKLFKHISFLFFFSLVLTGYSQERYEQKLDCYSVLVGKKASKDSSVILAHNEDTGGDRVVNYFKVPNIHHKGNDQITFMYGGKLEQTGTTNAYLWINLPGAKVCDSYVNEYGVAIASDGCPSREKNPDLTDGGILFWLRRIVAERARSAREGVKIAGKLIEKYGYADSGRTYVIADSDEGWMLAVVNGKHWVAARVPDDEVAVIPNYYTIGEINLSDTVNFAGSPDIVEYAMEQGWYNPDTDGEFHFAKAYSNPGSLKHSGNISRMWGGVNLASGRNYSMDEDLPFSFIPEKKLGQKDVMNILSSHYEGTELDHSKNYTLGNPYECNKTTICSKATQYSLVAQLRSWMPKSISARIWITTFRPDVQIYLPWYVCIDDTPEFHKHTTYKSAIENQFNPSDAAYDQTLKHTYWINKTLAENVNRDYKNLFPLVRETWDANEKHTLNKLVNLENKALKIYEKDPQRAEKLLSDFSKKMARKAYYKTEVLIKKTTEKDNLDR